jgi:hypothetical protein
MGLPASGLRNWSFDATRSSTTPMSRRRTRGGLPSSRSDSRRSSRSTAPRPRHCRRSSAPDPEREVAAVEGSVEKPLLLALELELNESLRSREERGPVSTALNASAHCSSPVRCPDMVDSAESTRWREPNELFGEGAGEGSAEVEEVEALQGELLKSSAVGGGRGNARR